MWEERERRDRQTYLRHVDLESLFCIVEIFVVAGFYALFVFFRIVGEREPVLKIMSLGPLFFMIFVLMIWHPFFYFLGW